MVEILSASVDPALARADLVADGGRPSGVGADRSGVDLAASGVTVVASVRDELTKPDLWLWLQVVTMILLFFQLQTSGEPQ